MAEVGTSSCKVCGSERTRLIFSGQLPKSCTKLPESNLEAIAVLTHPLEMHLCEACKHVFNAVDVEIDYDGYPMYNRGWQRHVQQQANLLSQMCPCVRCVDIGGGDCGFLNCLDRGKNNGLKGFCIDPNGVSDKFEVYQEYSDSLLRQLNPDTVIMRHTLEHFLDPREVLTNVVANVSTGTQFFIEVPNVEKTLERKWWCDFMPEHPQNFSRNSLVRLCAEAGLTLQTILTSYNGTVLTYFGEKTTKKIAVAEYECPEFEGFEFENLRKQVAALVSDGVLLWGAAGKSAAFLNHLMLPTSVVFDSDTRKVGKYVPGTGQKIYGIDDIPEESERVFVTTPWRANDIYKELRRIKEFIVYTYSNDFIGMV